MPINLVYGDNDEKTMEKFYPPIHIRQIIEYPDKVEVYVQFYDCTEDELKERMINNGISNSTFVEERVYETPKMSASMAREYVYKQLNHKKVKI